MPINRNTDLILNRYTRSSVPDDTDDLPRYLTEELQRLESIVRDMSDAAVQATDNPPPIPKKGMVRFSILPWNPLGNNAQQLVVYNGTAWVAV
jgi:hypothetical protein